MTVKIMYLVDQYEGPNAGTEGQLLQLLRHLDPSRYQPAVTLLRDTQYSRTHPFPCPMSVLGITRMASTQAASRMLAYARNLRNEGYRIVHCYFNDSSIIAPPFLCSHGIRTIVSRRDLGFWYTRANLAALRMVRRYVDRYVANSFAVACTVVARERVPMDRISVIYNGYEPSTDGEGELPPEIAALSPDTPLVGVVANLKPIKRLDLLLEAFSRLDATLAHSRLVLVGDYSGDEGTRTLAALQRQAEQLGVAHRVTFTGRLTNPRRVIERMSVAVLCSDSEGFSNSLIEYMQAGKPVVCTDTGGNSEVILNGRNGFLVAVNDAPALAARLGQLLADRPFALAMGAAARLTAAAYTHTRMVTEHMACYDSVLQRAGVTTLPYAA